MPGQSLTGLLIALAVISPPHTSSQGICFNHCVCTSNKIACMLFPPPEASFPTVNRFNYTLLDLGENCDITFNRFILQFTKLNVIQFNPICNTNKTCITAAGFLPQQLTCRVSLINNHFCAPSTSTTPTTTTTATATTSNTGTGSTVPYGCHNNYDDGTCEALYKYNECSAADGNCNKTCLPECRPTTTTSPTTIAGFCTNVYNDPACEVLYRHDDCSTAEGKCNKTCLTQCQQSTPTEPTGTGTMSSTTPATATTTTQITTPATATTTTQITTPATATTTTLTTRTTTRGPCRDASDVCQAIAGNITKCQEIPGVYFVQCQKSCDNCQCKKCMDATGETKQCQEVKDQGYCNGASDVCWMTCAGCSGCTPWPTGW